MVDQLTSKTILGAEVITRAVLYARVSGDDPKKDGRNLQSQLDMGREYAQDKNYRIIAELAEDDRGASGAEIDLPQLNRAREMASRGEFDVLVVREIDRLSRNLAKQLIIEEELRRAGVSIEYVLANYEDTSEGRLSKHIRATIAEYEREKIRERLEERRRIEVEDFRAWYKDTNGVDATEDELPSYVQVGYSDIAALLDDNEWLQSQLDSEKHSRVESEGALCDEIQVLKKRLEEAREAIRMADPFMYGRFDWNSIPAVLAAKGEK